MEKKNNRDLLKESTRSLIEADFQQYGKILEETKRLALEVFSHREFQEICASARKNSQISPTAPNGEFGIGSQISRKNRRIPL